MQNKAHDAARTAALGGVLAALAVVIMSMGTLIPVATYVCPMLCILICQTVLKLCGKRNAWAWYGAVSILSLLFAPDKEAAIVFIFLGYYPMVKPRLDGLKGKWLVKALFFNAVILIAYWLMIRLLGLGDIGEEFREMGKILTAVMLVLGNVTFFLLDVILGRRFVWRK